MNKKQHFVIIILTLLFFLSATVSGIIYRVVNNSSINDSDLVETIDEEPASSGETYGSVLNEEIDFFSQSDVNVGNTSSVVTGKNDALNIDNQEDVDSNEADVGAEPMQDDEREDTDSDYVADLEGVNYSIFGDSISTYSGFIPQGCNFEYPVHGAVDTPNDTWWMSVQKETGMKILVNDSSSGCTCIKHPINEDEVWTAYSDTRMNMLKTEKAPDIIYIFLGTNDFWCSVELGTNDGTRQVTDSNVSNFSDAYSLIIQKIKKMYPNATLYCCTLFQLGEGDETTTLWINDLGLSYKEYNDVIRTIAGNTGCYVIPFDENGLSLQQAHDYTIDGVHPGKELMHILGDIALSTVKSTYGK